MHGKPLWQIGVPDVHPRDDIAAMSFEYVVYDRQQLIEEHEVPYFIPARAINRKQLLAEPDDAR